MQENTERWMALCRQASAEQDPAKLALLTKQINDLLLIKRYRLEHLSEQKSEPFRMVWNSEATPKGS